MRLFEAYLWHMNTESPTATDIVNTIVIIILIAALVVMGCFLPSRSDRASATLEELSRKAEAAGYDNVLAFIYEDHGFNEAAFMDMAARAVGHEDMMDYVVSHYEPVD